MKVIKEADVRDGFTRRITYHIPRSTRQVNKLEYTGPKQIAYCGHSIEGHLGKQDFTEYESVRDLSEGEYICPECVSQLSDQGVEEPYQKILADDLNDPRVLKEDTDI